MSTPVQPNSNRGRNLINVTLAFVAGQVGCLTLAIVMAAVLGGLWLDNHFGTKPTLTIILLLVSIPVSLGAMILFTRAAVGRIRAKNDPKPTTHQEEGSDFGKDS